MRTEWAWGVLFRETISGGMVVVVVVVVVVDGSLVVDGGLEWQRASVQPSKTEIKLVGFCSRPLLCYPGPTWA